MLGALGRVGAEVDGRRCTARWCWWETNDATEDLAALHPPVGGSASSSLLRAFMPAVLMRWWQLDGAGWRRCGCCILRREMNGPQALHPRGDEWRLVFGCILPMGEEWHRYRGCILRLVGDAAARLEACRACRGREVRRGGRVSGLVCSLFGSCVRAMQVRLSAKAVLRLWPESLMAAPSGVATSLEASM